MAVCSGINDEYGDEWRGEEAEERAVEEGRGRANPAKGDDKEEDDDSERKRFRRAACVWVAWGGGFVVVERGCCRRGSSFSRSLRPPPPRPWEKGEETSPKSPLPHPGPPLGSSRDFWWCNVSSEAIAGSRRDEEEGCVGRRFRSLPSRTSLLFRLRHFITRGVWSVPLRRLLRVLGLLLRGLRWYRWTTGIKGGSRGGAKELRRWDGSCGVEGTLLFFFFVFFFSVSFWWWGARVSFVRSAVVVGW